MITIIIALAIIAVIVKVASIPTKADRKAEAEFQAWEARYARGWRD